MRWHLSHKADARARPLADRHYPRRKVGAMQFAPPGRTCVLLTEAADALWISVHQEHALHAWRGAWMCSLFRNESRALSSELVTEAVSATIAKFGPPPPLGMITFVDPGKVRRKRDPGRCFLRAGFVRVGTTPGGHGRSSLVVLQLLPSAMPAEVEARPMIRLTA